MHIYNDEWMEEYFEKIYQMNKENHLETIKKEILKQKEFDVVGNMPGKIVIRHRILDVFDIGIEYKKKTNTYEMEIKKISEMKFDNETEKEEQIRLFLNKMLPSPIVLNFKYYYEIINFINSKKIYTYLLFFDDKKAEITAREIKNPIFVHDEYEHLRDFYLSMEKYYFTMPIVNAGNMDRALEYFSNRRLKTPMGYKKIMKMITRKENKIIHNLFEIN